MRYLLVIPILLLLSQQHLKCQQVFTGFVLSSVDNLGIEGTHIMNLSNQELAISSKNGGFTIKANQLDTLLFSNINFKRRQFVIVKFGAVAVFLTPLRIQLEEVEVSNLPKTAADFRKKVIAMEHQNTEDFLPYGLTPAKPKAAIPPLFQEEKLLNFGSGANPLASSLTILSIPLYYFPKKFSKKYKSEMKYHALKAEKNTNITFDKKFNREIVRQLTNFQGPELDHFIKYLDIDPSFVLRASEYEIAIYIQNKQSEFITLQKEDSSNVDSSNKG